MSNRQAEETRKGRTDDDGKTHIALGLDGGKNTHIHTHTYTPTFKNTQTYRFRGSIGFLVSSEKCKAACFRWHDRFALVFVLQASTIGKWWKTYIFGVLRCIREKKHEHMIDHNIHTFNHANIIKLYGITTIGHIQTQANDLRGEDQLRNCVLRQLGDDKEWCVDEFRKSFVFSFPRYFPCTHYYCFTVQRAKRIVSFFFSCYVFWIKIHSEWNCELVSNC